MNDGPLPGALRLEMDGLDLLVPLLKKVYQFEAPRISGPGSSRRGISEALWSVDELTKGADLDAQGAKTLHRLLKVLKEKRAIMEVKPEDDGRPVRYLTRVAETVRLLGHNYEYWHKGRPGVEAVRWLVADKTVPKRRIPVEAFIKELTEKVVPQVKSTDAGTSLRAAIATVVVGIAKHLRGKDWEQVKFSAFQLDAARAMLRARYSGEGTKKSQILTAGVGSGKTIAFAIPLLVSAVEARLSGTTAAPTHLLLYPRTALAQDQFKIIEAMAKATRLESLWVHLEHHSYYKQIGKTVKKGLPEVYGGRRGPPDLIITTLETLKRRLQYPAFAKLMASSLSWTVLDEIHLIEGLTGTNVIRLMGRLRQVTADREVIWTGSSATVAVPDLHMEEVFQLPRHSVAVVAPDSEEIELVGLVHHVFLRPAGIISTMGVLVNSTSILLHNRRDKIGDRPSQESLQKTIGFADNLDVLGRWNADLRENERTEDNRFGRRHPTGPSKKDHRLWEPQEREVPYALRFHNPLTRRLRAKAGQPSRGTAGEEYGPVPAWAAKHPDPCSDYCRKGLRKTLGEVTPEELHELGRFVNREPTESEDPVFRFSIENQVFEKAGNTLIGTLDLCPYLDAGACFWFPREDFAEENLLGTDAYEWKHVARSKIHTSKKRDERESLSDELEDIVFRSGLHEIYDVHSDHEVEVDVVLASPSLEVGIDLSNVTEEIMHKAIRNIASYRQKAGRAGREEGTDTIVVTVLSARPIDFHYYRQPSKLISEARLDPIPLKAHHVPLLKSALYSAVWDFLALRAGLPEAIPLQDAATGGSVFAESLDRCLRFLDEHSDEARRYLRGAGGQIATPDFINGAIEQARKELGLLLLPTAGAIAHPKLHCVADLVANRLRTMNQVAVRFNSATDSFFDGVRSETETYSRNRPVIDPLVLGIASEFHDLDWMRKTCWDRDRILGALKSLEPKIRDPSKAALPVKHALDDTVKALGRIADYLAQIQTTSREDPRVRVFHQQLVGASSRAGKERLHWLSYLIDDLPIFSATRSDPAYVRPESLFSNPYERKVVLQEVFPSGDMREFGEVGVGEALFSLVPGTWTYRLGNRAYKVLCGELAHQAGGVLSAEYGSMTTGLAANRFVEVARNVPAPPGRTGETLDILRPVQLALRWTPKYVLVDPATSRVMDKDEASAREGGSERDHSPQVKVPQTFLNRWVHVVPASSEAIHVCELDAAGMSIEGPEKTLTGAEARQRIRHPLQVLFDDVGWHKELQVTEYVYSASRSYTSREVDGTEVVFRREGKDIAFGDRILTEGVSFTLSKELVERITKQAKEGILHSKSTWAPTAMKALAAALGELSVGEDRRPSPFAVRDLLGILMSALGPNLRDGSFATLAGELRTLLADRDGAFEKHARRYLESKHLSFRALALDETRRPDAGGGEAPADRLAPELEGEIDAALRKLRELAAILEPQLANLEAGLDKWTRIALLNTFGVVAVRALQRLSGTSEGQIGYALDLVGVEHGPYVVYIYDRDEYGNGTSDLVRRYLHILYIQRAAGRTDDSRLLPSEDYLTILEQELLQCPQFHVDMNALEMHRQRLNGSVKPDGIPELGYVKDHSREVESIGHAVWSALGVLGREDAWMLPLLRTAADVLARDTGIGRDDILRATTICWNGCPECVVGDQLLLGPLTGGDYVDKSILDLFFKEGRQSRHEYKSIGTDALAASMTGLDIGVKSQLCLDTEARRYRAVSLPFTIGVELSRSEAQQAPVLVLRDNDSSGLDLLPGRGGEARGITVGFPRLVWFSLLTSAYLASLEWLSPERKDIIMIFYDIREVFFDYTGISERMRETIEAVRRDEGDLRPMTNLTEMILWLSRKGFRIRICVDERHGQEPGVAQFLSGLKTSPEWSGTVERLWKNLGSVGSLHVKGLLTPVCVVDGSANLTRAALASNEELVNFSAYGTPGYEELRVAMEDILKGARPWTEPV